MPTEDGVSVIMPLNLFDEKKRFILVEVPYCEIIETTRNCFINLQMKNIIL